MIGYNKSRKDMPTSRAIFHHWKKEMREEYNRDIQTVLTCFACLREGYVQRCHIDPLHLGGSNKAKNLHLLCPNCHVESEGYLCDIYWLWFENKDTVFIPMYRALESGILITKIAGLIKDNFPDEYKKVIGANNIQEIKDLYYGFIERIKPKPDASNNSQSKLF